MGFRHMGSSLLSVSWSSRYSPEMRHISRVLLPQSIKKHGKYERAWKGLKCTVPVQGIVIYLYSSGDRTAVLQNGSCINTLTEQRGEGFPESPSFPAPWNGRPHSNHGTMPPPWTAPGATSKGHLSVPFTGKTCLSGKIRATAFRQSPLWGYWISEILYLRNLDGR